MSMWSGETRIRAFDRQMEENAAARNEIDAIFASKKRRKVAGKVSSIGSDGAGVKKRKRKQSKAKKVAGEAAIAAAQQQVRKKTQDGFSLYKEEELGWNKKDAGGTAQCPFDCDCCF